LAESPQTHRRPCTGWQEREQVVRNDLIIYEIMGEALDENWWREFRRSLESRFQQPQSTRNRASVKPEGSEARVNVAGRASIAEQMIPADYLKTFTRSV
jgi:hypothetical protein